MSAAANALWYVPHKPDLLLLAPCDGEGPLPCPGSMFVSIDHLHDIPAASEAPRDTAGPPPATADSPSAAGTSAGPDADASSSSSSSTSTKAPTSRLPGRGRTEKWRHPRTTAFVTAFGDIAKQQPRVARCACGATPCALRGVAEGGAVPPELIPGDWATKWELPAEDSPAPPAPEARRANVLQLWLDCTARAEKELPQAAGGQELPDEERVLAAAQVLLTDCLKGRVCFNCNLPSTRMQKCSRCLQARYCSRDCQRAHWPAHKAECAAAQTAKAAQAAGAGEAAAEPAKTGPEPQAGTQPAGASGGEAAERAPGDSAAEAEATKPPAATAADKGSSVPAPVAAAAAASSAAGQTE